MTGKIVWIASYPKSGNTWLRAVYSALRSGTEPNINRLESPSPALRALFDQALAVRSSDLTPDEVDTLRPRADEVAASLPVEDMFRKIHDALVETPAGELIVSTRSTRAALYILRDPRDIAVSWAHHADVPLGVAVEALCSPEMALASGSKHLDFQVRQRLGTWSQHVRSWTEAPPFPVHVVRYEDCLATPVATFHQAFSFAGIDASVETVARAVDQASFERLKSQERKGGFRESQSSRHLFFRGGSAGSWKQVLAPEMVERLLDEHAEVMARYGYLDDAHEKVASADMHFG